MVSISNPNVSSQLKESVPRKTGDYSSLILHFQNTGYLSNLTGSDIEAKVVVIKLKPGWKLTIENEDTHNYSVGELSGTVLGVSNPKRG